MAARLRPATGAKADPMASGMPVISERSRQASDVFLAGLRGAADRHGTAYAGELAEAHIDAGARYLDDVIDSEGGGDRAAVEMEAVLSAGAALSGGGR